MQFQDSLHSLVNELERHSIDYRAIGSVAAEAHGIFPIDFSPRKAVDQIDMNPDLDVIVPRSDLPGAREVRSLFEHRTYPIKLGLAIPSMQVDLNPSETTSRLTWGNQALPIPSSVFVGEQHQVQDVVVTTVPAETLRHFYSEMSPRGESGIKYLSKLAFFNVALGTDAEHTKEDPYKVFHDYAELMQKHMPLSRRTMELFYRLTAHMTPEQRNRLRHVALKAAGVVGWR